MGRTDRGRDGYYGGDFDVEDQSGCSADSDTAIGGQRMDGAKGIRGSVAYGGLGAGTSFLDRFFGGDGFLLSEPEDWVSVEQCIRCGRALRNCRVRIHVLGGDATFECETRVVFMGSDDHGDHHAHFVCGIADCDEREKILEITSSGSRKILKTETTEAETQRAQRRRKPV